MAGGGCQGGISGLKVCDFEVPPRQRGLCSVSALATTKTQKYRHAKYACLILAPLYSLHTAPLCLGWNPENELPRSENSR